MTVIRDSTLIDRTPQEAFDHFVDIRNELEWNSDAVSMVKLTDGPIGTGTRSQAEWRTSGHIELTCVRYDRPVRSVHVNARLALERRLARKSRVAR